MRHERNASRVRTLLAVAPASSHASCPMPHAPCPFLMPHAPFLLPDGGSMHTITHDMFALAVPVAEKILRPILVYILLVVLLRVFGKRELAQLNPFDLVVLLSLSNTVQNAIIGDDNSVT